MQIPCEHSWFKRLLVYVGSVNQFAEISIKLQADQEAFRVADG